MCSVEASIWRAHRSVAFDATGSRCPVSLQLTLRERPEGARVHTSPLYNSAVFSSQINCPGRSETQKQDAKGKI